MPLTQAADGWDEGQRAANAAIPLSLVRDASESAPNPKEESPREWVDKLLKTNEEFAEVSKRLDAQKQKDISHVSDSKSDGYIANADERREVIEGIEIRYEDMERKAATRFGL